MRKIIALLFGLSAAFVAQVSSARDTLSNDYCACITRAQLNLDTRYDGGLAASFRVPAGSQRHRLASSGTDDLEERYAWRLGRLEIQLQTFDEDMRVNKVMEHERFDHPPSNVYVVATEHGRASIEAIAHKGRRGVRAFFEDWPQPYHGPVLGIFGDQDAICSWGAAAIKSLAPRANAWQNLTVISVAPDQKSFRYRNGVGLTGKAYRGTVVAKDYWKVSSISASQVMVRGLEEDGAGGFVEVNRPLKFEADSTDRRRVP